MIISDKLKIHSVINRSSTARLPNYKVTVITSSDPVLIDIASSESLNDFE